MIIAEGMHDRVKAIAKGLVIRQEVVILREGVGKISKGGLEFVGIIGIFGGVGREKIAIQSRGFVVADGDGIGFERTG